MYNLVNCTEGLIEKGLAVIISILGWLKAFVRKQHTVMSASVSKGRKCSRSHSTQWVWLHTSHLDLTKARDSVSVTFQGFMTIWNKTIETISRVLQVRLVTSPLVWA